MLKVPSAKRLNSGRPVALPAAVFNRSPMKRSKISQNSCNINLSSSRSYVGDGPACFNHPNKQAKFYMISEQDQEVIQYCQKCAILLASQGFKVNRYEQNLSRAQSIMRSKALQEPQKPTREQQLQEFLKITGKKLNIMEEHLLITQSRLNSIHSSYDSNQSRIQRFFKDIFQTLENQKNSCLQKARYQKQSLQQESKGNSQYLKEKIKILKEIIEDIEQSFDSIVKDTPDDDYSLVMEHYKKCVQEAKHKQPHPDLHLPFLPSVQNMQAVISDYLTNNDNATHFSFDQSSKRPF